MSESAGRTQIEELAAENRDLKQALDAAPLAWYVWTQGYSAGFKDSDAGNLTHNPYAMDGETVAIPRRSPDAMAERMREQASFCEDLASEFDDVDADATDVAADRTTDLSQEIATQARAFNLTLLEASGYLGRIAEALEELRLEQT